MSEKHEFDLSYRRTGKTTQLCEEIAGALKADPELQVILTGAHVIRQERMYRRMLTEAGADLKRVRFIAPSAVALRVRGFQGKLFCDDYADLSIDDMRAVDYAQRFFT